MGTQTMGSHGDYGGVDSNAGGGTQEPKLDSLAREGSLYNLTLDEVQNQLGDLGKPLSSMNLDELLKSVWTAEANHGLGRLDYGATQQGELASASSLHGQLSVTLSRDLSKKTVDEVWQDIQQGQKKTKFGRKARERKSILGEMTLEDFLVKAGVVAEGEKSFVPHLGIDPIALPQQNVLQQAHWMPYQIPSIHQPPQQQQQNVFTVFMPSNSVQQALPISTNPIMDAYPETQMTMSTSALMGTLSDTQTLGRKRIASGDVVEKTVERRQKRMIKNRESAARSRARKQAYTHELENKISRLEEENEKLKRRKESLNFVVIFKLQRNEFMKAEENFLQVQFFLASSDGRQRVLLSVPEYVFSDEVEKVLPCVPPPEPKYQLRRTSSATF